MCKVTVVDSIMGSGKTSWAIEYMNMSDERFIYITPFKDEVDRIVDTCSDRYFYQPSDKGTTKLESMNKLLKEGYNIASTHANFSQVNADTLKYLKENDYILILDEVMKVVEEVNITKKDLDILFKTNMITVLDDGKVIWNDMEYEGQYDKYKKQFVNGDVYFHREKLMLWTFPTKIFEAFKEVYVMTYLFEGQIQAYYYKMNNIEFDYKSVACREGMNNKKHYYLTDYTKGDKSEIKQLVNLYEGNLNSIGNKKGKENPLSSSWFKRNTKTDKLLVLKKNMENYFQKICKTKSDDNMWCVFKEYRTKCKGNGYAKGYVNWNERATNKYQDKTSVAYCVNVFLKPMHKGFFEDRGIEIHEDTFALAEMLQFIWRSRIRKGEKINLYIPSERMRQLFIEWLND